MNKIGDVMRLKTVATWHSRDDKEDHTTYRPGETFLYSSSGEATHLQSNKVIPLYDSSIQGDRLFDPV